MLLSHTDDADGAPLCFWHLLSLLKYAVATVFGSNTVDFVRAGIFSQPFLLSVSTIEIEFLATETLGGAQNAHPAAVGPAHCSSLSVLYCEPCLSAQKSHLAPPFDLNNRVDS